MKQINLKTSLDRPGMSSLNEPMNSQMQQKYKKNPVPVVSKRELVEKWLFNYNNKSDSTSTGSSVVFDSPSPKRVPLSPLKGFRERKRFKCADTKNNQISPIRLGPIKLKKNECKDKQKCYFDVSKSNITLGIPESSGNNENHNQCSPKSGFKKNIVTQDDLEVCRNAFFGKLKSPKRKYFKPISPQKQQNKCCLIKTEKLDVSEDKIKSFISQFNIFQNNHEGMVIDEIEKPEQYQFDVECSQIDDLHSPSVSPCFLECSQSVDRDSPSAVEILSVASSQVANECIEIESSETNEIDRTIDTENDLILNEAVEDAIRFSNVPNHDKERVNALDNNDNDYVIDANVNDNVIDNNDNVGIKKSSSKSTKSESQLMISEDSSDDPDRTFYMEENEEVEVARGKEDEEHDDVDKTLVAEECSQKISQDSSSVSLTIQESASKNTSANNISIEATPQTSKKSSWDYRTILHPTVKRKKKPKKGSLLAKLHNLVTSQTSFVRIWRYQINQNYLTVTPQSVTVKINRRIFQYGRLYIMGTIIDDKFNLLDDILQKSNFTMSRNDSKHNLLLTRSITILIAPEVVGKINFNNKSILNIYQPWEIIDVEKLILSVLYCTVNSDSDPVNNDHNKNDPSNNNHGNKDPVNNNYSNNDNINSEGESSGEAQKQKEIIIQQFSCPCLSSKRLDQSCDVKSTNMKPSIMEYIFDN